jgi:hypothetical protein
MRVHDTMDDPGEVIDDLDEEMPDAAEDAREMAESESVPSRSGLRVPLGPSAALPPPPTTIAFEGADWDAEKDSEAESEHSS